MIIRCFDSWGSGSEFGLKSFGRSSHRALLAVQKAVFEYC